MRGTSQARYLHDIPEADHFQASDTEGARGCRIAGQVIDGPSPLEACQDRTHTSDTHLIIEVYPGGQAKEFPLPGGRADILMTLFGVGCARDQEVCCFTLHRYCFKI